MRKRKRSTRRAERRGRHYSSVRRDKHKGRDGRLFLGKRKKSEVFAPFTRKGGEKRANSSSRDTYPFSTTTRGENAFLGKREEGTTRSNRYIRREKKEGKGLVS